MTTIFDIKSVDWQMATTGPGDVVEGINDIKQAIQLIITTSRGSDPLRPEFGTDIFRFIDRPVNTAAPQIVGEILTGIQLWEPRVRVAKITHAVDGARLLFDMTLQVIQSGQAETLLFEIERASNEQNDRDLRAFSRGFTFAFS